MRKILIVATLAVLLTGCAVAESDEVDAGQVVAPEVVVEEPAPVHPIPEEAPAEEEPAPAEEKMTTPEEPAPPTEEEYRAHSVNEMGEVMVIMYHNLAEENTAYARRVEDFKKDLQTLYDEGYRPVSLSDYVNGRVTTPMGTTPFVLTFDDGHITNFRYIEVDGERVVDPDSVVGILESFHERYEDFDLEATFFLNGYTPFGEADYVEEKINYIVERGMDIGNHSYGHEHLDELSGYEILETLGKNARQIENWVEDPDYRVAWLALPYGERPSDEARDAYVVTGEYEGFEYAHEAILKVGWRPEFPPYHEAFDFRRINRVQSGDGDLQLTDWLEIMRQNPNRRYVSDGDPQTIVIPQGSESALDQTSVSYQEVIIFEK